MTRAIQSYLSVLRWERYKSPHNHRRWPQTITKSCQSSTAEPSHLGGGNHQEQQAKSTAKHEYQVPLDAITQAMHLDPLPISQR